MLGSGIIIPAPSPAPVRSLSGTGVLYLTILAVGMAGGWYGHSRLVPATTTPAADYSARFDAIDGRIAALTTWATNHEQITTAQAIDLPARLDSIHAELAGLKPSQPADLTPVLEVLRAQRSDVAANWSAARLLLEHLTTHAISGKAAVVRASGLWSDQSSNRDQ